MGNSKITVNLIYQGFYQILIIILPFITSPYIARVLGPEKIGVYSYTYSVVFYFGLFACLGINNYGQRSIAKVAENKVRLSKTFSSIFVLHLFLSIIAIMFYVGYCAFIVDADRDIAFIQIIYLLSVLFDINWFFWGLERFKITVTRNTIIKILTVIFIFIFVRSHSDLWKYTLIMTLGTLLSYFPLWILRRRYAHFIIPKYKDVIVHLKPMFMLFSAALAVSIYIYIDKVMLGLLSSMSEVGFYENANKMIEFPVGLVTALGVVMLPRMSNLFENGKMEQGKEYIKKSMFFAMLVASAIAWGVYSIADNFSIVFWGEAFRNSGPIMSILSINVLFISWNNVIRTQYLIPLEKDKIYLLSVWSGAIIDIIMNLIFIPIFGGVGAAIGTISAYAAVCFVQTFFVRRDLPIKSYLKESVPFVIAGLLMYIVVNSTNTLFDNLLLKLSVKIIVGILFYSLFVLIFYFKTKNPYIISAADNFKYHLFKKLKSNDNN